MEVLYNSITDALESQMQAPVLRDFNYKKSVWNYMKIDK